MEQGSLLWQSGSGSSPFHTQDGLSPWQQASEKGSASPQTGQPPPTDQASGVSSVGDVGGGASRYCCGHCRALASLCPSLQNPLCSGLQGLDQACHRQMLGKSKWPPESGHLNSCNFLGIFFLPGDGRKVVFLNLTS